MKGVWGGDGVAMEVADAGATVQFDCAHGTIGEKIVADSSGGFVVKGRYVQEHPGPTRQGEENDGKPAIYSGTITNQTMTMKIVLDGSSEAIATYTLVKGKNGRIRRCG